MSKKTLDPTRTAEAESLFRAYEEYAKTLRTWFVAYGIGGPVLLLTNEKVQEKIAASGQARTIALFFLLGVVGQVVLAFVNKTALWANYYAELNPHLVTQKRYRFAAWLAEQFWIDFLLDVAALWLFAAATWRVFNIVT